MVSYECPSCGGSGKQEIIIIRGDEVNKEKETCSTCYGSGIMRNGEPSTFQIRRNNQMIIDLVAAKLALGFGSLAAAYLVYNRIPENRYRSCPA